MGKVPQGATFQGPTGLGRRGTSPLWPWTEPCGRDTPRGLNGQLRLGPTALEYEVPEGQAPLSVKYRILNTTCYVSSIS